MSALPQKLTSFSNLGSFCKKRVAVDYFSPPFLFLAAVALSFWFCGQSNLDQAANCPPGAKPLPDPL